MELVLYLGVVAIFLTAAVMFTADFLATQAKAVALAETAWNARFVVGQVGAEIRQAANYDLGSSVFDLNPSTLALTTNDAATNPTVFAVADGRVTVKRGSGSALPLTSSKVEVTEFVVHDLSQAGRSRNFRIEIKTRYRETGLWAAPVESLYETTERIRQKEGFAN